VFKVQGHPVARGVAAKAQLPLAHVKQTVESPKVTAHVPVLAAPHITLEQKPELQTCRPEQSELTSHGQPLGAGTTGWQTPAAGPVKTEQAKQPVGASIVHGAEFEALHATGAHLPIWHVFVSTQVEPALQAQPVGMG